ncbi:MAG: hypothetical protein QG567_567 [Campylobacterota bacterium]|nr:hypothetical protein [Campylobacterota bacterium]
MGFVVSGLRAGIVKFVKKVHIAIILDAGEYSIRTKIIGQNGVKVENKVFSFVGDKMPPVMIKYLSSIQKKYSHVYISTLLSTINAGAINGCSEAEYKKMHIETDSIVKVCIDDKWSAYSSMYAIEELKDFFGETGIDYIFPYEIVIDYLLKNNRPTEQNIYIINTCTYAIISIFSPNGLLYSAHFIYKEDEDIATQVESESLEEMNNIVQKSEKDNEVFEFEDASTDVFSDDLDDLDSFGDIENPQLDDVNMSSSEVVDEQKDNELANIEDDIFFAKKDQLLSEFVHNSIEDFYKSSFYKSEFIKKAKIYNACTSDNSGRILSKYIKEELFLECELEQINLCDILCEISILESQAV